jgi:hypothetical protein
MEHTFILELQVYTIMMRDSSVGKADTCKSVSYTSSCGDTLKCSSAAQTEKKFV